MAVKKTDSAANYAALKVTESAANTQTSAKFAFPFSIQDKMALIVNRIEYWWQNQGDLNSSGDYSTAALTVGSAVVDITNQADPIIVDTARIIRLDYGAAASGALYNMPFIKDFSSLPGGGLLVAPAPLYAMIQSVGAAAALAVWIKLFYTSISLSADEYWELVESRRIISS